MLGVLTALDFSANLVTFYVCYEMMTLTSLPLVLHEMTKEAVMAGLKYLFYSVAGAFLALFGIFYLYGAAGSLTVSHVRPVQTVIDVSVSWDAARNAMVGDAEFDAVSAVVDAITPVPGGVGTVTSAVLMRHVVLAAERGRK